ncbi:DUF3823 domain-containing protein [Sphingobacterium sp. LRF_L2]|uniref:DUF3823 domain-containing protein n=1 Tax=Sphingobacterium sp. LRF_L2 TaxID=3369421 RepID=UPI003F63E126
MKMKFFLAVAIVITGLLTSCEYDNFEEPSSMLTGKVMYENTTIGVRRHGTRLQVIQKGYALQTPMDIYIDQDGTYSAVVSDGDYKLFRVGDAPWLPQAADTIEITVKGNTQIDVPVTPYFTVEDESFLVSNNSLIATFKVNKIVSTANVDAVKLYLGETLFTDNSKYEYSQELDVNSLTLGTVTNITAAIPSSLQNLDYVFARVGVKSTSSGEYYYSQVQKIALK